MPMLQIDWRGEVLRILFNTIFQSREYSLEVSLREVMRCFILSENSDFASLRTGLHLLRALSKRHLLHSDLWLRWAEQAGENQADVRGFTRYFRAEPEASVPAFTQKAVSVSHLWTGDRKYQSRVNHEKRHKISPIQRVNDRKNFR